MNPKTNRNYRKIEQKDLYLELCVFHLPELQQQHNKKRNNQHLRANYDLDMRVVLISLPVKLSKWL